ncbi:MAG: SPOR domain-containing protein [Muribaculaceae bacterium]|nr:SPOR domain-containing protein [Muribaculaceae bacterium]
MKFALISAALLAAVSLTGCKTTEANYRAAYEKAVSYNDVESDSLELNGIIYGKERRNMTQRTVESAAGPVDVVTQILRATEDGGLGERQMLTYNVAVGQFKQLFNAKSMRERLVEEGYKNAFVAENPEPFYYVIIQTTSSAAEAKQTLERVVADGKISMREPCPMIISRALLKQQYPLQKR